MELFLLLVLALISIQSYADTIRTSAIYAQSNNPAGNQIYVYEVDLNSGNATFKSAVDTNDNGGGTPHSQYSLVTSGNYLLAANGGSNSISLFWIDNLDPTNLTFIGKQSIQGNFPTSIAATSSWGNLACVVTSYMNLTLSCYQFNQSGLFYQSAWTRDLGIYVNDTSFPTSQVSFSPQDSTLVIQFKGLPTGALIFLITGNTLAASPVVIPASQTLGPASYGFVFTGPNQVVTTDAANGIVAYTIASNGNVSSGNTLNPPNTAAYCWMVWSPLTNNVYGIAAATGNVTEISVTSNNSLTIKSSLFTSPSLTDGVIVSGVGTDWLFVLSRHGITLWKITGVGSLSYLSAVSYPADMYNSTMAGLAGIVTYHSGASALQGSCIIVLMLAILATLLSNF